VSSQNTSGISDLLEADEEQASKPPVPRALDLGPLAQYIGFHLRRAQDAALRAFIARSHQPDFKPGRFAMLMVIRLNPGLTQTDLCRAIGRDKSTVSPLLREFEAEDLIRRIPSERDRRSMTLQLTPRGDVALDELLVHVEAHDRRLDEIVGPDKAHLISVLDKIASALE
jgi:DNA-binding MarR family transcriptional regulator